MSTSTTFRRPAKKQDLRREAEIAAFWRFIANLALLQDSERLQQIKIGFPAHLIQSFRLVFDLQDRHLKTLFNASISTLEKRRRAQTNLDPVGSERLDRIAAVSHLAERTFEDQVRAAQWLSTPNSALNGTAPIMLCETEIGAKQVRRILQALEWGSVV